VPEFKWRDCNIAKTKAKNLQNRFVHAYFDIVYNPTYDFATARLISYRKLLQTCISKLRLSDNDRVLCVGLGTGNEIVYLLEQNKHVDIVGVDLSKNALKKSHEKASALHKGIELMVMDVHSLEFSDNSFDKVICLHVMDFLDDITKTTYEIIRVLKEGGEFLITYPSQIESQRLGLNILRDSINHKLSMGTNRIRAFLESISQLSAGIIYLPLMLRSRKIVTREELTRLISELSSNFNIEEYPAYCDYIVYGSKST